MKLCYLPNEPGPDGLQVGPRRAFECLNKNGRIDELQVISFLQESARLGSDEAASREIINRVRAFGPDILVWQHVSRFQVDIQFARSLRNAAPHSLLVYHEGDAYSSLHKRMTPSMLALISTFDVVFQVALGPMQRLTERAGGKLVNWIPSTFDAERFPGLRADDGPSIDVVMIGNLVRKVPHLWELPGSADRYLLAQRLTNILGNRFAIYGMGWDLPTSRGPLRYDMQHEVLSRCRVSVGWDHFPGHSYYFSDRLPIALAAGVPHVNGYHPGYEHLFRDCPGLFSAKTVGEAVDATLYLLGMNDEARRELGKSCRDFAFDHLEATSVFATMFDKCCEHLANKRERFCLC